MAPAFLLGVGWGRGGSGGGSRCKSDLTSTMVEICWPSPLIGLRLRIWWGKLCIEPGAAFKKYPQCPKHNLHMPSIKSPHPKVCQCILNLAIICLIRSPRPNLSPLVANLLAILKLITVSQKTNPKHGYHIPNTASTS